MFDTFALVAAFGGGIVGAYMGALPAFIMTGIYAIIGGIVTATGTTGDIAVGILAFGSFVGPHIAFAGGVAAAAYAASKGKLASGADICSALNGLGAPDVLLVGGIFGVLGYVIATFIGTLPIIGAGQCAATDLPGITVIISGIISRLVFGKTGLTGKYTGTAPRQYIASGAAFMTNVVLGLGIGILVAGISVMLKDNPAALGIFPIIVFGFAAITLIFSQTGFAMPATHQIFLPGALAAGVGLANFGPAGALAFGIVFAILGSVIADFVGRTFNSYADSHIDPPAMTIFFLTSVISAIGSALAK